MDLMPRLCLCLCFSLVSPFYPEISVYDMLNFLRVIAYYEHRALCGNRMFFLPSYLL
jgi:hypothetical protein